MRRSMCPWLFVCFFLTACQSSQDAPAPPAQPGNAGATPATAGPVSTKSDEAFVVDEPVRFKNLVIFPVSSRIARNGDRYITLDEGLKAGTVEISELGVAQAVAARASNGPTESAQPPSDAQLQAAPAEAAADVNRLTLVNRSQRPLYLMPGEIVVGGKQDRSIAKENDRSAGWQADSNRRRLRRAWTVAGSDARRIRRSGSRAVGARRQRARRLE